MRFLLVFLFLFASLSAVCAEDKSLEIIVYKDQEKQNKVLEFFLGIQEAINEGITETSISGGSTIYSNDAFSVGFNASSEFLKHKDVLHDPARVLLEKDGISRWHKLKVKVKTALGPKISIPSQLSNVGISFSAKFGLEEEVTIITPTNFTFVDVSDEDLGTGLIERVKQTYGSFRHIKLPLTIKNMLRKFEPGFEFSRKGIKSFATNVGASASASLFSASGRVYATVKGLVEKRIKFLDENVVLFELKNIDEESAGVSASLNFGITVYQVEDLMEAGVKVNLLSASKSRLEKGELCYRYLVDIRDESALHALERAWNGDLTSLQDLAVSRNEAEENYSGVFADYEKTSKLTQIAASSKIGFDIDNTFFELSLAKIKYRDLSLPTPLLISSSTKDGTVLYDTNNLFQEEESIERYFYERTKKGSAFFNLIASDSQNISVASEVKKASMILDENYDQSYGDTATFDVMKLTFNYKRKHTGLATDLSVEDGLNSVKKVFSPYQPQLESMVDNVLSERCKKKVDFNIRGTFYETAINQILKSSVGDAWVRLADYLEIAPRAQLRYPETRRKYRSETRRLISHLENDIRDMDSGAKKRELEQQVRELRTKLIAMGKFERKYIPIWEELLSAKTRSDKMRLFKELFEAYKKDELFVFTILSMKLGGDFHLGSDQQYFFRGGFINYNLKGKNCNYQFSQTGDLMYKIGDVISGWN